METRPFGFMCSVSLFLVPWHVPGMSQHHSGHRGGSRLSWSADLGAELGVGKMSYLPGAKPERGDKDESPTEEEGSVPGAGKVK